MNLSTYVWLLAMEEILQISSIEKSYGDLKVLKGLDLSISKSEVVTIVGPSGAGKSTLLHIIGTLDAPDQGRVSLAGQSVSDKNKKELSAFRNQSLGFVFQFHNLLPEFTALENICIPGLIGNRDEAEVKARALELLNTLGIAHRAQHKPSELSGGEQQRVAVARALINDPLLILADEPSGNLDSANAKNLHDLFFELRDQYGYTFVIVTHNEQLAQMADRSIVLKDGLIVSS